MISSVSLIFKATVKNKKNSPTYSGLGYNSKSQSANIRYWTQRCRQGSRIKVERLPFAAYLVDPDLQGSETFCRIRGWEKLLNCTKKRLFLARLWCQKSITCRKDHEHHIFQGPYGHHGRVRNTVVFWLVFSPKRNDLLQEWTRIYQGPHWHRGHHSHKDHQGHDGYLVIKVNMDVAYITGLTVLRPAWTSHLSKPSGHHLRLHSHKVTMDTTISHTSQFRSHSGSSWSS